MALGSLFKVVTDAVSKVAKSATSGGSSSTPSGGSKSSSSPSGTKDNLGYQPAGAYKASMNDFINNYQSNIAGISKYNNVDMGVAREMLYTNLRNNNGYYKGGGVVDDATWQKMRADAQNIFNNATASAISRGYDPATGRKTGGGSSGGGSAGYNLGGQLPTSGQLPAAGGGYAGGEYQALIDQIMGKANRDALVDQLNQALSPDYYTQNFNNIMTQLNPLYQQQRNEIMQMADQQRGQVDIDAERRGIYNSGVPANLRQDVNKMETQAIANALAQLQAQATQLVGDQQDRVLQSIGMQGDWMNSDKSSLLGLLDTMTGYDLGRLNSDRNYSLGMLNSDRDYQINMGKLGLGQQEMALNNLKFQEEQRQFDRSLVEKQRQYDLDYDFKERSFAEDVRRFESEMGLKWSQLNASNKSSWIGAELDRAKLAFQREQWADEKSAANAAQNLQRLQYAMDGYADIQAIYNSGGSRSEAMSIAGMYNQYVGSDIGSDLKKTIDSMGWTTKGSSSSTSSSSKSGGLNQQAKDLIKAYKLGPGNMMN